MDGIVIEPRPARLPSERPGPPGGKRDRNRRLRTRQLMEAALPLFLERGLQNVTLDDIARNAGMAKANFYRYFEDREALVEALLEPISIATTEAVERCEQALARARSSDEVHVAYRELSMRTIELIFSHRDMVRFYLQERRSPAQRPGRAVRRLSDRITAAAERLSRVACDHGLVAVADPRISAYATLGAIEELVMATVQGRLEVPATDAAEGLIGLVLDGVRARPA